MSIKQLIQELSGLPSIEITHQAAVQKYGGQVAAIMDRLAHSNASDATKQLAPRDFTWKITYRRAKDPPGVSDPQVFTNLLVASSECWLKATGNRYIDYEPISITPAKVLATYEQYAKLICGQRTHPEEPEEGTDIESPATNGELTDQLQAWLLKHPHHDKRLAYIANEVLEKLMETGT